jgi:NAD(P)-dependent dehydrogenase (short-subunit alcohol dehydrogenase family)
VEDWENMIDINIKGVLYGIAAALPVFRKQGFGHIVNTASTAGISVHPNMAVYAGTKFAVCAISEGLRQEAGDKLRVTIFSPGFVNTNFAESMSNPEMKAQIREGMDKWGSRPTRSPAPWCSRSSSPPLLMWARLLCVPRRRVNYSKAVAADFAGFFHRSRPTPLPR